MSLREKMARYEKLTGDIAERIPLGRLGGFLDGVDRGIEELEKIKAEIKEVSYSIINIDDDFYDLGYRIVDIDDINEIIDKHIEELKGESKEYEAEVITRGNCMICRKELTEGLFICKECENKANSRK